MVTLRMTHDVRFDVQLFHRYGGYIEESGFEYRALWPRSQDRTSRPPRTQKSTVILRRVDNGQLKRFSNQEVRGINLSPSRITTSQKARKRAILIKMMARCFSQ
ncbi:hypothetical protein AVEN_212544-1 [Araneus ventricosus]|uniref:Uncharacterized protein n=1 Tax=Araneus ventricosus TaxID=182803 RepID=A0A4Y2JPE0_ARAVE|nr:hypothetical protein AVEN_212544-1 [Araneus ventricosus]